MKNLKQLILLSLAVILSVGFSSCEPEPEKGDANLKITVANLTGSWKTTHQKGWYKDFEDPSKNETWDEPVPAEEVVTLMLNVDGKGQIIASMTQSLSWRLDKKTIFITAFGEVLEFEIIKLTSDKAILAESSKDETSESYEEMMLVRQ